jgi:ABC-2 type transport system permease protein
MRGGDRGDRAGRLVRRAADKDGADVTPLLDRESRGARFRSVALAVAWRNIHNVFTNPALLLPSVIFPLFFFAAFAGGLSRIDSAPGFNYSSGYTAFEFVFVLLQSAAFGGVFTGFSIARDFEMGFGRRLLLAAPRREAIMVGYSIAALVRAAFTILVITTVALAAGMQIGGSGVDLFGLYGLAVLVNIAATLWAGGIALRLRTIQAGPAMQMPVFLTLFLAPVYVPVALLSGWVHAVATVNPATALLNAGRHLIAGTPADIGLAFAIAAGLIAAFSLWALRGMRSAEAAGGAGRTA